MHPLEGFVFSTFSFFFPFFPCCPHDDAVTFRLRKYSLSYSCWLCRTHTETRRLRHLLPRTVCPWPEVVAPPASLESLPFLMGCDLRSSTLMYMAIGPCLCSYPGLGVRNSGHISLCPLQLFLLLASWGVKLGWLRELICCLTVI